MKYLANLLLFVLFGFSVTYSNQYFNQKNFNSKDEQGRPVYHRDRIYVKFKKEVNLSRQSSVDSRQSKVAGYFGIESVDGILKRFEFEKIDAAFKQGKELPKKVSERLLNSNMEIPDLSRIYMIKLSSPINSYQLINELNNNPNIEYAEYVPINYPTIIPNDSLYSQCQHLPQIFAEQAWDLFKGENSDSTILIGVCDTGTDWNHPDLNANLWQNLAEDADKDGTVLEWVDSSKKYILDPGDLNGIDDDGNGFIDDVIGWDFLEDYDKDTQGNNPEDFDNHGTHVAGICAGVTNNSIGIASVSWNVKFVPTSHSSPGISYILRGYEGIVYLAELGCDIINCSWGGGGYSRADVEAVEYASSLGALVVVAAGNANSPYAFYPSAYPNLVSVASVASNDVKAGYSNYGNHVDISAPGGASSDGGIMSCIRNKEYRKFQGTSMASPVAASVFGLVKAKHPKWSNQQLIRQVIGTCDKIDTLNKNYQNKLGNGRVNAFRALTETNPDIPKILKLDLMNVEADDSTENSNNNKALEPDENIRIGFLIRNYAILTGSESTDLTLSCDDEDIEIVNAVYNTKFTPDGYTETPMVFELKIADTAKSKFVTFTITAESDDAEIVMGNTMTFELPVVDGGILIWEGLNRGTGFSGAFISEFLNEHGVETIYTTNYPVSFVGYDAVMLSFGSVGSGFGSLPLNDWMAQNIIDYLKSGGKLYIEGMDILGYDQVINNEFLNLLGVDSAADGSNSVHNVDSIFGQQGTICEGLVYWKSSLRDYRSIDEIYPNSTGKVALIETSYGNVAIQNEGEFGQKSFFGVYPINGLIDRDHPNSRYEIIKRILDFLDIHMDYTIPRFSYSQKSGHAPLLLRFKDISYSSRETSAWDWDFLGNGDVQTKYNNDTVPYEFTGPGDYMTKMTIHNSNGAYSVMNPLYVFDGESAIYLDGSTRGRLVDTNMNVQGAFTFEAWALPSVLSSGAWVALMNKEFISFTMNNEGKLKLYVNHDNRTETDILTTSESVKFNIWQHVAVSFDGDSTYKIYVDGKEMDTTVSKGPGKGAITNNKNKHFGIGKYNDWEMGYEGRIDELRFWGKNRTNQEIRSTMFRKLDGNEEGLLVYWQYNEGNGNTAMDLSSFNRTCSLNSEWRQGIHEGHIISQPKSSIVCEGDSYEITTNVVSGPDSLIFQWTRNGELLKNAPDSKYYIEEMTTGDVGKYQLIITNADTYDREFSDTAFIDIELLPDIIEQPVSTVQYKIGDTLRLKIRAESKSDISYEWYKNDEPLEFYEPEYIKENAGPEDAGRYNCLVMNNCGLITSQYSIVSVVVNIEELNKGDFGFDISPNPVNENSILNIRTGSGGEYNITVSDIFGREVYKINKRINGKTMNYNGFFKEFDLNTSGLYMITLEFKNRMITKPIIFIR